MWNAKESVCYRAETAHCLLVLREAVMEAGPALDSSRIQPSFVEDPATEEDCKLVISLFTSQTRLPSR